MTRCGRRTGPFRPAARAQAAWLAAACCCLLGGPLGGAARALEPEEAVESAREALDQGWVLPQNPWYDAQTDDLRRIPVREPYSSRWLEQLFSSLLAWLRGLNFSFDVPLVNVRLSFFQVLAWLAALVVAAVLVYVLRKVYLKQQARKSALSLPQAAAASRSDADRIEALPLPVDRAPDDLLGHAEDCYRRGQYGEAIKYLFSHQLVELDKSHLLHLAKGKTNRQYLRELGPRRALAQLLEQSMVAFEDVFFGSHPLARDRFEACWTQLGRFRQLLEQAAA